MCVTKYTKSTSCRIIIYAIIIYIYIYIYIYTRYILNISMNRSNYEIDINNLPISTPLSAGCEPDYENGVVNTDIDPDCNFFKTLNPTFTYILVN